MFNKDIKYSYYYDENTDPLGIPTHQVRSSSVHQTDEIIYMNAIQTFFHELDENNKVSFYMLSKSKIYACYKLNDNKSCVLKIVDNSKLNVSNDSPILYRKKINMSYVCDHAFGNYIAILFQKETSKYCLQIYNQRLHLEATKDFDYQINPILMTDKELFCLSMQSNGVHVFDFKLNTKKLFYNEIDSSQYRDCFRHRSFWICGANDHFLYVDNRNLGFDVICRNTGCIFKTIYNNTRKKLPAARIDSNSCIIMINDLDKIAYIFDQQGNKLNENKLDDMMDSLEDNYIFSTKDDDFYLLKHNDNVTELNFFKTKQF